MKLKKLVMKNYGKFTDKTIEFSDSLNVVLGENESGKSTARSFIRQMLYGFGSKADGRDIYRSWGTGTLEGELYFSHQGREYCVKRRAGSTKGRDTCELFDLTGGETLDKSASDFIGVCEDTFCKSVFIAQDATLFHGESEEIASRLSNLARYGDENAGADKAIKMIEKQQTSLLHKRGRGGKLAELEDEIHLKKRVLRAAEERSALRAESLFESQRLKSALDELYQKREDLIRIEESDRKQALCNRLCKAKEELFQREKDYTELQAQIAPLSAFSDVKSGEISEIATIDALVERQKTLHASFLSRLITCIALLITAAASVFAGIFISSALFILTAAAFFSCVFAAVLALKTKKDKDKNLIQYGHVCEILSSFNCSNVPEFTDKLNTFTRLKTEAENLSNALDACRAEYAAASECCCCDSAEYQEIPLRHETSRDVDAEIFKITPIYEQAKARLEAETDETPEDIAASIKQLEDEHKEYSSRLLALNTALSALDKARRQMEHEFTPRLNRAASEILGAITHGRHDEVRVTGAFEASILDDIPRAFNLYSFGTAQQVYLALRLALSELLFPNEDMFIVLDEPFAYYDSRRQKAAEDMLLALSEKRQIIIFVCRDNIGIKKTACNYIDINT
ncbi:MAG: AAA family ATPase [Clostridia bacterium]|nr:AAA family ATPase [Clostridia bacterium]